MRSYINSDLIDVLSKLRDYYGWTNSKYKASAYNKAIGELKRYNKQITKDNLYEVKELNGIGAHLFDKICEFLHDKKIKDYDKIKNTKKYKAFDYFSKILGVGSSTINKWISMKIYNKAQLINAKKQQKIKLTKTQELGLKYYNDLNERMPHNEVSAIVSIIKRSLIYIDPKIIITVAGSYRRKLKTSGDIDILVSNKLSYDDEFNEKLKERLSHDNNVISVLSCGIQKLTFLYKSPISKKVRQIDILNLPYYSYWSGVLYFTGDATFNQVMRGIAAKLGYRLNQNGLYKIKSNNRTLKRPKLVVTNSEKDIFDELNMRYLLPEQRSTPLFFKYI